MGGWAGAGQGAQQHAAGRGGADGCMRQTAREAKCNWLTRVATCMLCNVHAWTAHIGFHFLLR